MWAVCGRGRPASLCALPRALEDPCTINSPSCMDKQVLEGGRERDWNTELAEYQFHTNPQGYYSWGLGHCQLSLFLDTDCLSYHNRMLFNTLPSCLKLLVLITTSMFLLCLPHCSSRQPRSFPSCFLSRTLLILYLSLLPSHVFLHPFLLYLLFSFGFLFEWYYITCQMTFLLQHLHSPV